MEYEEGDQTEQLSCAHQFHQACINTWLRRSRTCPLCRTPVPDIFEGQGDDVYIRLSSGLTLWIAGFPAIERTVG
uniref:RING-type domain-containing protein n=1 Tax=Pyxicephalus adspersus TaxID=30357 RepID=A0AAV3BB12_PYXAD|nr:TPA: hypothetical protein GDO54_001128 [Pyxicephalus adspersus]